MYDLVVAYVVQTYLVKQEKKKKKIGSPELAECKVKHMN